MRTLIPITIALAAAACAPSKPVAVEDVPKLTKLDDLMDAQAAAADPQFKKSKQESFTDDEFGALVDSARHIQATSLKMKDFSKGAGFDALAVRLGEQANALLTAAQGKDAAASRGALVGMKAVCKECHSKFK
jgi:cytochrome c556